MGEISCKPSRNGETNEKENASSKSQNLDGEDLAFQEVAAGIVEASQKYNEKLNANSCETTEDGQEARIASMALSVSEPKALAKNLKIKELPDFLQEIQSNEGGNSDTASLALAEEQTSGGNSSNDTLTGIGIGLIVLGIGAGVASAIKAYVTEVKANKSTAVSTANNKTLESSEDSKKIALLEQQDRLTSLKDEKAKLRSESDLNKIVADADDDAKRVQTLEQRLKDLDGLDKVLVNANVDGKGFTSDELKKLSGSFPTLKADPPGTNANGLTRNGILFDKASTQNELESLLQKIGNGPDPAELTKAQNELKQHTALSENIRRTQQKIRSLEIKVKITPAEEIRLRPKLETIKTSKLSLRAKAGLGAIFAAGLLTAGVVLVVGNQLTDSGDQCLEIAKEYQSDLDTYGAQVVALHQKYPQ